MRASGRQKRELELGGWAVQLRSYVIGEQYLAEIEVVSSGVTIACAIEPARLDAEQRALQKALNRLQTAQNVRYDLMVGG